MIPILPGSSQSPGGTFSIALYSPTEASIGPIGSVEVTIAGAPTDPPQTGSGTPITEPVVESPPVVMGVLDVFQTTDAGHNRDIRRATTRLAGFALTFNEQLDAGNATSSANYSVVDYVLHGRRLVAQSIRLRATLRRECRHGQLALDRRPSFPAWGPSGRQCGASERNRQSVRHSPRRHHDLHHPAQGERHRAVSVTTSKSAESRSCERRSQPLPTES